MLDNSGTEFKVYTFYYKPFQNGKGFKWASKKRLRIELKRNIYNSKILDRHAIARDDNR